MATDLLRAKGFLRAPLIALCCVATPLCANEAISRSMTVVNGVPPFAMNEAIFRAVTVQNGNSTVSVSEAISRAVTIVNGAPAAIVTEAISRATTVVNSVQAVNHTEAISRAATICNSAGLADIDSNGAINNDDVAAFVGVLLGTTTDVLQSERCDHNCDGFVNGLDTQPFVEAILQ